MLAAHMDLLRGSQSAWLKFASFVDEAFLFAPLHPELLDFKLLCGLRTSLSWKEKALL